MQSQVPVSVPQSSGSGVAGMSAPTRLSPSALDRYRQCPRRFALQDVARKRMPSEPSPVLAVGNAVHHALERFFGLPGDDRSELMLHTALRSVWREHAKSGTFATREEEAEAGRSALAMLSLFVETFDTDATPAAREQWVSRRLSNGVTVFGKLDRVDVTAARQLHVIDYKTGRVKLEEDDLPTDAAAQVYLLGAERATGAEVARVRILYLASGTEVRWEPEREDVDAAEQRLTALTDSIRADRTFEALPGRHCEWCPYRFGCPASQRVGTADLSVPDDILF